MHHRVTELLFKPYSVNKTPNNTGLPQRQQRLMEVKRDPKELTCQTRHPILDHFDGHLKESCHMVRQGAAFWLASLLLPPIHIDQSYNMNTHTHTWGDLTQKSQVSRTELWTLKADLTWNLIPGDKRRDEKQTGHGNTTRQTSVTTSSVHLQCPSVAVKTRVVS